MSSEEFAPVVYVDIYKCAPGRKGSHGQRWRWRAKNAGNNEVLAVASEAYFNEQDCLYTIRQLFGSGTNVYLRQHEAGNMVLRMAPSQQP